MRLGFDLRPFLKQETGVGVYLRNLLQHLAQLDQENQYFLFSSSFKDRFPRAKIPAFRHLHFYDGRIPVSWLNFMWHHFSWPPLDYFFQENIDLTHSATPLPLPCRGKKIVTVHDLFFLDFPEKAEREARRDWPRRIRMSLEQADGIITFSSFMHQDILSRFPHLDPDKVRVIPHGLDPFFLESVSPEARDSFLSRYSLPSCFILFVGTLEARKNIARLIQALKKLEPAYPSLHLFLVGKPGREEKNLRRLVVSLHLEEKVHFLGYVSRAELKLFYHLATALVFPSLCEGFGFPLLEAMACGLPVACSRTSSLPEVAAEAAIYFHPEEVEDIALAIASLLDDVSLRRELSFQGKQRVRDFSWEKAAATTLAFYGQLLGSGNENTR